MGKSSRLVIVLVEARLFCFGVLAILVSLPRESSVGAVTFAFSGFEENYFHLVSNSSWIFNSTTACLKFDPGDSDLYSLASGRFLYPSAVQMIDPGSTTVKSWSTTFIYQLQLSSDDAYLGPGMAFCIVPDNITLGAPRDSMGLITEESAATAKNYESDNHTLGVELDNYRNPEFNDTNDNHIGINLASMTSVYSFKPVYILASSNVNLYQQIWIDYSEADSRVDIFYANYKEGKPAEPQGSQSGLDLSLLKENMYIGFSSAHKSGSGTVPHVCAWSFSNDGSPAPPIVLAQDATASAPPPPGPVTPAPPLNGPAAAPSVPPPASTPSPPPVPSRSPAPYISSPPPPPASNPSPLRTPNPSPSNPPSRPPPSSVPPQDPNSESPTIAKIGGQKKNLVIHVVVPVAALLFVGLVGLCVIVLRCWLRFLSHPLRIFISHAGSPDGSGKIFPKFLYDRMTRYTWSISKLNAKFFLDSKSIGYGEVIAKRITEELERFDVGLVIVTKAFFEGRWPMTELIAFVEAQKNDPTGRLRVLPLFYELTPDDIKDHLRKRTWESEWEKMNTDNHPLEVEKCRDAVNRLCSARGILYGSVKRDQDDKYIEEICESLDEILRKERSFASYIWRAKLRPYCIPNDCRPRMTRNSRK